MARIVLADPLIDVIAPGEPLASGGGKINAALASINTMTSELYAAVGYLGQTNMVSLGASALRRTAALVSAPTAAQFATVAFKFTCPPLSSFALSNILGDSGAYVGLGAFLEGQSGGTYSYLRITLRSAIASAALVTATPAVSSVLYQFVPGTTYTVHIASDRAANTNQIWINGVATDTLPWINPTNPLNFSLMTILLIGADVTLAAATDFSEGLLGFVYVGAGTTSAWKITDPTKFYTAEGAYLGPVGQAPNGFQPLVFVGGQHYASDWLAGTNFGYGGNFSVVATT